MTTFGYTIQICEIRQHLERHPGRHSRRLTLTFLSAPAVASLYCLCEPPPDGIEGIPETLTSAVSEAPPCDVGLSNCKDEGPGVGHGEGPCLLPVELVEAEACNPSVADVEDVGI